MEESPKKRARKPNWEEEDRKLLLQLIRMNLSFITGKLKSYDQSKLRSKKWKDIQQTFNTLAVNHRTTNEIKRKWKSMKLTAKDRARKYMRRFDETDDGGPKPPSPTMEDREVMRLLPDEVEIPDEIPTNPYDSNAIALRSAAAERGNNPSNNPIKNEQSNNPIKIKQSNDPIKNKQSNNPIKNKPSEAPAPGPTCPTLSGQIQTSVWPSLLPDHQYAQSTPPLYYILPNNFLPPAASSDQDSSNLQPPTSTSDFSVDECFVPPATSPDQYLSSTSTNDAFSMASFLLGTNQPTINESSGATLHPLAINLLKLLNKKTNLEMSVLDLQKQKLDLELEFLKKQLKE